MMKACDICIYMSLGKKDCHCIQIHQYNLDLLIVRYLPYALTVFTCNKHADFLKYKWKRCSKKKCWKQCWQVKFMGTMTKWPVQKHTEHHKTRSIQRRNIHKEITIFCVFRFFWFLFSIFNYLKDFSRKCWITASVRSMKNIGDLTSFPLQQTSHLFNINWGRKWKYNMKVHSPPSPFRTWKCKQQ